MQLHYPLNPATGVEDPTATWTNGVPQTGEEGSYPPYQVCTNPQQEIVNVILAAGMTPTDADLTQLNEAITHNINIAISEITHYAGIDGVAVSGANIELDVNSLPAVTTAASTDFFPVLASGTDSKISLANLTTLVQPEVVVITRGEVLITESGTFTVPAGVSWIKARVWAGGGGGSSDFYGAGGQAGGYGEGWFAVTPGATINITVGAGGGVEGAGGSSSAGTFITAIGGSPAGGSSGGTVSGAAYSVNGPTGQTGINDPYVIMSGTPGAGYGSQIGQESDALAITAIGPGSGGGPNDDGYAGQIIIEY